MSGTIKPCTLVQQITPPATATKTSTGETMLISVSPIDTTRKASGEATTKPKDMAKKAKQIQGKEAEDVDEMWQEFSLEEELEGIADAPAKKREAMRAVFREKEEERRKRIRQSADEKRRIAEHEGYLLKKTFSRPAAQKKLAEGVSAVPDKAKQSDNKVGHSNNGNSNSNNSTNTTSTGNGNSNFSGNIFGGNTFGRNTFGGSGRHAKPGGRVVRSPPRKPSVTAKVEAPGQRSETVILSPDPEAEDFETDQDDSSGIISIEIESPKNAARFGVRFDPTKLDAATLAEVAGTGEKMGGRRSLLIQNIPYEYSLHKLLAHVRGGAIVMARLAPDTMGTGHGQVAMITFKTPEEASTGEKITSALLSRSEANEGQALNSTPKISVTLLPTPTYPSRETIVQATPAPGFSLAPVEAKTRCIYVTDFPKQYIHDLCTELMFGANRFPSKMHALEEIWFEGDTLHLQFASMQEAEKAHRIISIFHFRKYSGQVHYRPDPCAATVSNMNSLFEDGAIKVASHGYMGLKSLLETVGLASFSRSHDKSSAKAGADRKVAPPGAVKMSFSTLLSQTRTVPPCPPRISIPHPSVHMQAATVRAKPAAAPLIDVSFEDVMKTGSWSSVPASVHDDFASPISNAPWTADQMEGLDMF
ncbi:hypothetical protein SCUCBS95973_007889 [Sporothrix curviconia]|uniref:RRM domain-containing protein n=1 Tax=Sporothrix curviconia TaxID=1260050 RepID=A0ABP0CGZ1_9PEZI